ncbi:DNA-directed RNA polymerase I subunit RPA43 [Numida meleagris]|uniref:DNA-directed RNA polymerase I subunit RPA43 n=1 Tax=Numida meleagris TaxID=8996 RepID=UPI000B3E3BB4|nr:DNA-directed RNA polymerase I subunit RPA43 [Numida meleagris]
MAVAGELPPPAAELPSFAAASALVWRRYSCLVVAPHRRHVALPPRFLGRKRTGIRAQLDAELLRYSESLQGVPVAYDNVKVVGELGDIHDDQGFIHLNVEANFVIFSPKKGKKMVGVINKVAPSHIGCLIHGCFNASIPKPEHMSVAEWQELGFKIGDELKFRVVHLDSDAAGVFFIRGQLTKTSMQPKQSETVTDAVTDGTNGEQIQNFDNEKNGLSDSGGDNVTEDPLDETDNTGGGNTEEQSIDAVNEKCDDKKKRKKKKKHKQEEQEHVLPASDSSGYQSDLKKSKKKKRKHCEVEESELPQLSQEPKAKKKRD